MNLAQQLINGLVLGSGYALIAIGWTVLLGAARLVNFAHGQLYMLAAFIAWAAMTKLGVDYFVAVPIAVVVLGLLGVLLQGMMLRLVMQQNLTSLMIVTLGLGYVLQGGSALIFGGNPHTLPGTLARAKVDIGPLWFTWQDVLVLVVTLALYGVVWLFTQRTRFGSVIRAVAEDPQWLPALLWQASQEEALGLQDACIGTSLRHGCRSLVNFEILPQPPADRASDNPWPTWPKIFRVDYGHEEAAKRFGADPRVYSISGKSFDGKDGRLTGMRTTEVKFVGNQLQEIPNTEKVWKADLILIAMGFLGPEHHASDALGVAYDPRSNLRADYGRYATSVPKVFAAGDCRRGQSLVVRAINEGREAAREIDRTLMGETLLP